MKSYDTKAIAPELQDLWNQKGSDRQMSGALGPGLDGDLRPAEDEPVLSGDESRSLIKNPLPPAPFTILERRWDFSFYFFCHDRARLRSDAFTQKGKTAPAKRMAPSHIPSFAQLGHSPADKW